MDMQWARNMRDRCLKHGTAFFFKQQSAFKSGVEPHIDGEIWQQVPKVV